jgi:hypothetical protein
MEVRLIGLSGLSQNNFWSNNLSRFFRGLVDLSVCPDLLPCTRLRFFLVDKNPQYHGPPQADSPTNRIPHAINALCNILIIWGWRGRSLKLTHVWLLRKIDANHNLHASGGSRPLLRTRGFLFACRKVSKARLRVADSLYCCKRRDNSYYDGLSCISFEGEITDSSTTLSEK